MKVIAQIIVAACVLFIVYCVLWCLFAFATNTYDTFTGTDDGFEYYWEVYKKH